MIAHSSQTGNVRVHKQRQTSHFTQLSNDLLRNKKLSFKARGILAHLLSHEEGWIIRMSELESEGVDKETSIRSGVDELIAAGYMRRSRVRDGQGRLLGWEFEVFDVPNFVGAAVTETRFSSPGFSSPGFSSPGKSSAKNNKLKNTISKNKGESFQDSPAPAAAGCEQEDSGFTEDELAHLRRTSESEAEAEAQPEAPAQPLLLTSEDEDTRGREFPWRQVAAVLNKGVPGIKLPNTGDRRDAVMKQFWRNRGKAVSAFELLAAKVSESDFLMGRNGHNGRDGKPYPWSWVFDKGNDGKLRADKIMDDAYSNEKMAFVLEKKKETKLTKVMTQYGREPVMVDLSEHHNGEPRYMVTGTHHNGLPDVIDLK